MVNSDDEVGGVPSPDGWTVYRSGNGVYEWVSDDWAAGVIVLRRNPDGEGQAGWFGVYVDFSEGDASFFVGEAPDKSGATRVAVDLASSFDGSTPPSKVQRALARSRDGKVGTRADEEWPGLDNYRRTEAWEDLLEYTETYSAEAVIEAALARDFRTFSNEQSFPVDQFDFEAIQSAFNTFGIEFVIEAAFAGTSASNGLHQLTVGGKSIFAWRDHVGTERDDWALDVYPEDELPQEVNGWKLVGSRPDRVVYRSGRLEHAPAAYADNTQLYLEATRVDPPGVDRERSSRHPYGLLRQTRSGAWTRGSASKSATPVGLLDSLDEAVTELREYMGKWPPRYARNPSGGWGAAKTAKVIPGVFQRLLDEEYASEQALADAFSEFVDAHDTAHYGLQLDEETMRGEARLNLRQANPVMVFFGTLHPTVTEEVAAAYDRDELPTWPFEESSGEWREQFGMAASDDDDDDEGFFGTDTDTTRRRERRAKNKRERRDEGQMSLGDAHSRKLDDFGVGPDNGGDRATESRKKREKRRERRDEERRTREDAPKGQKDLTGSDADHPDRVEKELDAADRNDERDEQPIDGVSTPPDVSEWDLPDGVAVDPEAFASKGARVYHREHGLGTVMKVAAAGHYIRYDKDGWTESGRHTNTLDDPESIVRVVDEPDRAQEGTGDVPDEWPATHNGWTRDDVNGHDVVYHRSGDRSHDGVTVDEESSGKVYARTVRLRESEQADLFGNTFDEAAHQTFQDAPFADMAAARASVLRYLDGRDGDGAFEGEETFDDRDVDVPERPDEERREWNGYLSEHEADADYYALAYVARIGHGNTRTLLNKYQSAARVINFAKTTPRLLTKIPGIGDGIVEKLTAVDVDDAVLEPGERDLSKQKLREAGTGPEGQGLAAFEDAEGDGSPAPAPDEQAVDVPDLTSALDFPEQVGSFVQVGEATRRRVMYADYDNDVSVLFYAKRGVDDGWQFKWTPKPNHPQSSTIDGTWAHVDIATGEPADADAAERRPFAEAAPAAYEWLATVDASTLRHPWYPYDAPRYLPPTDAETVLDVPTHLDAPAERPDGTWPLEKVTVSANQRLTLRYRNDAPPTGAEFSEIVVQGQAGSTGWTVEHYQSHPDRRGRTSEELPDHVTIPSTAGMDQALFRAASVAEHYLAGGDTGSLGDTSGETIEYADSDVSQPRVDVERSRGPADGVAGRVVLVACGKQKASGRLPARDKYTSGYFGSKRAYAEAFGDAWYVLSAGYGLVDPDRLIDDYDVSLADMSVLERSQWAEQVVEQLDEVVNYEAPETEVVVLGGVDYVSPIASALQNRTTVHTPLQEFDGMGPQQSWLTARVDAGSPGLDDDSAPEMGEFGQAPDVLHGRVRRDIEAEEGYRIVFDTLPPEADVETTRDSIEWGLVNSLNGILRQVGLSVTHWPDQATIATFSADPALLQIENLDVKRDNATVGDGPPIEETPEGMAAMQDAAVFGRDDDDSADSADGEFTFDPTEFGPNTPIDRADAIKRGLIVEEYATDADADVDYDHRRRRAVYASMHYFDRITPPEGVDSWTLAERPGEPEGRTDDESRLPRFRWSHRDSPREVTVYHQHPSTRLAFTVGFQRIDDEGKPIQAGPVSGPSTFDTPEQAIARAVDVMRGDGSIPGRTRADGGVAAQSPSVTQSLVGPSAGPRSTWQRIQDAAHDAAHDLGIGPGSLTLDVDRLPTRTTDLPVSERWE